MVRALSPFFLFLCFISFKNLLTDFFPPEGLYGLLF